MVVVIDCGYADNETWAGQYRNISPHLLIFAKFRHVVCVMVEGLISKLETFTMQIQVLINIHFFE